ncbi:hypothetical protein VB713_22970 [Anabaena cylindrica UHCC 0172]|uniref:hypothetical protein n=1 Tax=Anabaena cylindrica TaxID=1165 RepID=UPI002B2025E0|nr:hypothetical protein [Anabaena cylindrica]MEA5553804.1 hypothetical protein [Anabaena cylindrica UHCC 0172]
MSIDAFVDNGYAPGIEFCEQFLSSNEFTVETLESISSGSSRLRKNEVAANIANDLAKGKLTPNEVLVGYVKQPRRWLSLKSGSCTVTPNINSAAILLTEFGKDGWYGPIEDATQPKKKWYIRIYRIVDSVRRGTGTASKLDECYIRWSVIAEVGKKYAALSWYGFTYSSTTDEHIEIENRTQFPFWNYIPGFINELANHCQANWEDPNLQKLVLHDMWDKYLNCVPYKWQHLRIRAEASGLVINAHSAGVQEVNVKGLKALSERLANSVLQKLGLVGNPDKMNDAEDAILLTLIKEWGTKSYEFQLDKELTATEIETEKLKKVTVKRLIKTHCYFGLKPGASQDSLQHLKCYGGSTSVLEFLLKELELQG